MLTGAPLLCTGIFDGLHEHAAHHLRILAHNVLHDHRPDNQILLACRDSNRPHVSRALALALALALSL